MITDKIKANAIALLKLGDSPREISDELEIPYMLVRNWADEIGIEDLTELKANTNALERIITSEVLSSTDANTEMLKLRIEETALKIVERVKDEVKYADLPTAKALQLMAQTCSTLYTTVINKGNVGNAIPGTGNLTMFDLVAKD